METKLVYDKVNARVITENDSHLIFYTDTFNTDDNLCCDDEVVETVVEMFNSGYKISEIVNYVIEADCGVDVITIISNGLVTYKENFNN